MASGWNVKSLLNTETPHSVLDKSNYVVFGESGDIVIMNAVTQSTARAGGC